MMIKFFVASNNRKILNDCILENPYIDRVVIEFDKDKHIGLPERYNRFIEQNINSNQWLCMMHDDVWLFEPIPEDMPKDQFYGLIGAIKVNGEGELIGQISMTEQDQLLGNKIEGWKEVTTCDPLCIIGHSSLFKSSGLRFDENLSFHLHFEELSIRARKEGIKTCAVGVKARHLSWGEQDELFKKSWLYVCEKHGIERFVSCVSRQSMDHLEQEHWA